MSQSASLLDRLRARQWRITLHFNKGLAGAPAEDVAAARDTATNPAAADAFALAISASEAPPAFGVTGRRNSSNRACRERRKGGACRNGCGFSGHFSAVPDFRQHHPRGRLEIRHRERIPHRRAAERIEATSPHVDEALAG